jgi:[protein-PII] uridylyltransferase
MASDITDIKKNFLIRREKLFKENLKQDDSFKFSLHYSLLVEEFIRTLASSKKFNFALASAGSFCRRELSPFSDIDLMFICSDIEENEKDIVQFVTLLWDNGIEVSHTVRNFADIQKFLETDLHSFTQLLETRFLLGSDKIYSGWNEAISLSINDSSKRLILSRLFEDINQRYEKYGDSPKVLEPNLKLSPGCLRDFHTMEWIYIIYYKDFLQEQQESTRAEIFIRLLEEKKIVNPNEIKRLMESYKLILSIRNFLHLLTNSKTDRFEFNHQTKFAELKYSGKNSFSLVMKDFFKAASVINRFSKSMVRRYSDINSPSIPDSLSIELDEDFTLKGKVISLTVQKEIDFPDILRAYYYSGLHSAFFDGSLRSHVVELVEASHQSSFIQAESSVFFREILKLPKNVGSTLNDMNETGVLGMFLPEFNDLNGFVQHGVYHCYTADEHTIKTIQNLEKLDSDNSQLGRIYKNLKDKEILFLAMLFHDIAKPINIPGHEILGVEMASSSMERLGYSDEEIDDVTFLVRHHLLMEQVAFRRNLNDPETLNNFVSKFNSTKQLDLLYLVTYADLSAVNPAVWTSWKSDLLSELYSKSKAMLENQISGDELLQMTSLPVPKEISKHSDEISESHVREHIDSMTDISYIYQFSEAEIARHIEEINRGTFVAVLFKELNDFTNITVITRDFPSLLSKICGVLLINDANIHDAKIFTRKDGIVIDTFNVTDFRTQKKLDQSRYPKIESDMNDVLSGITQLQHEVAKIKSKWWRIESKLFKRSGKVKIVFEKHDRYSIIDVFSPDRLGFLYHVTNKMNELGLIIYFAKISTQADDIVDSFYVLNRNNKKISPVNYAFIKDELIKTINQIL